MTRVLPVFVLFSLACGGPPRRAETLPPPGTNGGGSQEVVAVSSGGISRESFAMEMRPILFGIVCEPSSYFRQCFAVAEPDCYTLAGVAYDNCARELLPSMPPMLYTEADGAQAGEMLGACTGTAYEQGLAMNGLRYDTPACNDPSNW